MLSVTARGAGIVAVSHLDSGRIVEHIDAVAVARHWKSTSVNAYLAAWRSFARWATRHNVADLSRLAGEENAATFEHGDGSRAPTTEEARAIMAASCTIDGRARSPRCVYFACLFLAGCRHLEPSRWLWSDLHLEAEIPHIIWRAEIQKNRRRAVLALAPELVWMLRQWREQCAACGGTRVFATTPNSSTFRADMQRAGVVAVDEYGGRLSTHSARKWYATTMKSAGVAVPLVDHLMRHVSSVPSRYYSPALQDQASALQAIPWLSVQWARSQGLANNLRENGGKTLASSQDRAESEAAVFGDPVMVVHEQSKLGPARPCEDAGHSNRVPSLRGPVSFGPGRVDAECGLFGNDYQAPNRGYSTDNRDRIARLLRDLADLMEAGDEHEQAGSDSASVGRLRELRARAQVPEPRGQQERAGDGHRRG